ncbi:hypothetical protein SAMN05660337_1181 [Maridesulfovibrio ferrireducens]|uniref:Restriction alleviation protein Lar n=1 Tax=Maridesulfovibrio ferrireducens TaxID=246191 RepID=A0A1G9EML5_9BACT|nr:hypothetical protein [Maridesulfovibrio ferrireducens]SDK77255.1 hypothetical protein SAMN05660337_1181 [Maridesulfovibrio ferrireducens]
MTDISSLLECPWCGAFEDKHLHLLKKDISINHYNSTKYYVQCLNCAAQGPSAATKEEAINFWGTLERGCEGEGKNYLQEFLQLGSVLFSTTYMDIFDFSQDENTQEISKVEKFYSATAQEYDHLFSNIAIEKEAKYFCKKLSYLIDHGAGDFSENYPSYPLRWKKNLPRVPDLLELLKKAKIDLNESELASDIGEVLSQFEEAQKSLNDSERLENA